MQPFLIFLVDDDPIFLKVLETQFKEQTHYEIKTFMTGEDCLKNLSKKPNIIFLDYYLNAAKPKANNGLKILDKIKSANQNIHVVMLSSQESIDVAMDCMKSDALDYIVKSEVTFMRAQRTISFLFNQLKLEKRVKIYKTTAITLIIWTAGILVSALISEVFLSFVFSK